MVRVFALQQTTLVQSCIPWAHQEWSPITKPESKFWARLDMTQESEISNGKTWTLQNHLTIYLGYFIFVFSVLLTSSSISSHFCTPISFSLPNYSSVVPVHRFVFICHCPFSLLLYIPHKTETIPTFALFPLAILPTLITSSSIQVVAKGRNLSFLKVEKYPFLLTNHNFFIHSLVSGHLFGLFPDLVCANLFFS